MILIWGALLGFVAVAFGAYAEHGLRATLTAEQFRIIMTALRYHQIHAVVIVAIGLALLADGRLASLSALRWSGWLFIAGVILFSFSIYLSVIFNQPGLVKFTPAGGLTIMAGWLLLLAAGVMAVRT